MKLEDSVYQSIHEYPSLFYHRNHPTLSDFEISRLSVLEHLFLTNGNGYCWVDGYMCSSEEAEDTSFSWPAGWMAEGPKYGKLTYADRTFPPVLQREKYASAHEYVVSWGRSFKWPFSIYPIGDTSLWLPEKVQPDWLAGARDICEFAIQFFADPHSLDGNNKPYDMDERFKSALILEDKLKEINARMPSGERLP